MQTQLVTLAHGESLARSGGMGHVNLCTLKNCFARKERKKEGKKEKEERKTVREKKSLFFFKKINLSHMEAEFDFMT